MVERAGNTEEEYIVGMPEQSNDDAPPELPARLAELFARIVRDCDGG